MQETSGSHNTNDKPQSDSDQSDVTSQYDDSQKQDSHQGHNSESRQVRADHESGNVVPGKGDNSSAHSDATTADSQSVSSQDNSGLHKDSTQSSIEQDNPSVDAAVIGQGAHVEQSVEFPSDHNTGHGAEPIESSDKPGESSTTGKISDPVDTRQSESNDDIDAFGAGLNDDYDLFGFSGEKVEKVKAFLDNPFWEQSFLLKYKKKKIIAALKKLDASLVDLTNRVINVDNVVEKKRQTISIPEGDKLVYVSLYQASGRDMMMWQITCNAISTCGFGRPIYLEEKDAKQWVTSLGANNTDGYAIVHVPEDSIIMLDKDESPMYDGIKNRVVHVKPGNLSAARIVKFVHYNQDSYYYIDGKLVLSET